jgi:rod shape-determining protein MreC
LRELNLQLSSEVSKMRHALVENKTLRDMVELKKKTEFPYVAAEVVGKSSVEMRNYITINKGRADGIMEGMGVRTDAGLVGIVVGVNDKYSLVESVMNREVKIAAKTQRSRIDGLIVWEGGEEFILKNVPKSFDVKKWDMIVTSDYSDKYPADIPIGKVSALNEDKGDLFLKIKIKPEVNFSSVEEVFVVKYIPDPERNALIRQLDELLKARKK